MKKSMLYAVFAAFMMLTLTACNSNPPSNATSDSISQTSNTSAETKSEEKTEPEKSESEPVALGTSQALGDWSITASRIDFKNEIPDGYVSFSPDEGNVYASIGVTVTNNGKSAANFLPNFGLNDDIRAKIIYNGEYEYTPTQLLAYSKDILNTSLNPLTSKEGELNFEVPQAVSNGTEPLILIFSQGDEAISYTLR